MTTLHQRLTEARAQLREAGVPDSEAVVDVGLFARTILGWDRARLITDATAEVPGALEPTFSQWIARRSRHEPTSYIVGVRDLEGVLDTAAEKLRLHGHLVTEIGFGQEPDVELLVAARPALQIVHVRSDLQGLPRTLVIQKTAQSAGPSDPPSRMTA